LAGAVLVLLGVAILISKGWAAGSDSGTEYSKTWTFEANELKDLKIYSDHKVKVSVETVPGERSVSVRGQGSSRLAEAVQRIEPDGAGLALDLREPRRGFFWWIGNPFKTREAVIVVRLAEGETLRQFGVHGDFGNIGVTGVRAETAEIDSDSGSMDVSDIVSGKLNIRSDSGTVQVRDLTADELRVSADSGTIKGVGLHGNSTVNADSGSIRLENVTGPISIHADSGSVKLYRDDNADTDISVDSGSIYARLPASFAGRFDLRTDSGKITAPAVTQKTDDIVKAHSDSGNIVIELNS
jgi:hypothetical protein